MIFLLALSDKDAAGSRSAASPTIGSPPSLELPRGEALPGGVISSTRNLWPSAIAVARAVAFSTPMPGIVSLVGLYPQTPSHSSRMPTKSVRKRGLTAGSSSAHYRVELAFEIMPTPCDDDTSLQKDAARRALPVCCGHAAGF